MKSFFRHISKTENGLGLHVLLSSLLFAVYCIWFRTPLVADDNRYFWHSLQEGFSFWDMGPNISRTPVHTFLFFLLIKLKYLEWTFYPFLILLFALHAASLYIIGRKLISLVNGDFSLQGSRGKLLAGALILFCFHPNFLEVLFMAMSAAGTFGAFFMAQTLVSKSFFRNFLFSLLTFGTYESFILPVFSFTLLPFIESGKADRASLREAIRKFLPMFLALLVFLVFRFVFSFKAGVYQQPYTLNWTSNIARVLIYYFGAFTKGYSSETSNYFEIGIPVLMSLVLGSRFGYGFIRKNFHLLILGLLSCAIDLVVPYDGIRVIYGSYFIKAAATLSLFHLVLREFRLVWFLIFCLPLVPVYGFNLLAIYKIRKHSYENQQAISRLVKGVITDNESSNTILLPPTTHHFHPDDWALENNSVIQYKMFSSLHKCVKNMGYTIIGVDTLKFRDGDFPLFYPARSFIYQYSRQWKSDEQSRTGQVFHASQGYYGPVVWGPYLELDSGNYAVEIALKPDSISAVAEFGDLTITDTACRKPYGFFPFRTAAILPGRYSLMKCRFRLPKKSRTLEFKVFSNGSAGFCLDYMRLRKQ